MRAAPSHLRDRPASRRGFTILEVLFAIAIFALAAVVLGAGYLNVLRGYAAVRKGAGEDQDVAYARQELLDQPDLTTAENGDEFDTAAPDNLPGSAGEPGSRHIKWTADIEPAGTTDLFTVTLTCEVTDSAGSPSRTVTQTFNLLRPTWSKPTDRSALRQAAQARILQLQGKSQ